ncbi:hypothetical protein RI543_000409 [Arxiozyma heterogenica]|uniref:Xylanolytic transcriptional activator regulatory domain-containing protein n=1 Tax=Arxiozyma heterogenica TaxID=278026 RepID=A0AAN8A857_9SACH|nr:hypothetical protein RI543_000409 [Kazachstania heterogenica]
MFKSDNSDNNNKNSSHNNRQNHNINDSNNQDNRTIIASTTTTDTVTTNKNNDYNKNMNNIRQDSFVQNVNSNHNTANDTYNQFLQNLTQQQQQQQQQQLQKDLNQPSINNIKNIDILLQQYGNDFNNTSNNNISNMNSGHSIPNGLVNPICITCLQNNWKCKWIPDLGKCAQCEGIQWKCELINPNFLQMANAVTDLVNNNILSNQNILKRDYSVQNENVKRHKSNNLSNNNINNINNINNNHSNNHTNNNNNPSSSTPNNHTVYSNFITNLYNSMSPTFNNTNNNIPNNLKYIYDNNNNITNTINMTNFPTVNINTSPAQTQYPRSSFYVGPTSVYDINIINSITSHNNSSNRNNNTHAPHLPIVTDQIQISNSSSIRKVSPITQFLLRDDSNQSLYLRQEQEVDMVEALIYPHGKILIDIFFKLIHPYFPILHERVFLEKYSRSYRELTAPLLASIYSLALQWWDFHPKLIGFKKPDLNVVNKLNDLAFTTFFSRIDYPKLSMIQTGLLILQCRTNQPNNWVICSTLVALAEELGLGVDCDDWKLPRWEKDLRKRLAWAVWLQDKWIALIEGRHSHLILGRNWLVKLLKGDDFPQSSHTIDMQRNYNNPNNLNSNNFSGNNIKNVNDNENNNNMMTNNEDLLGKNDLDSANPAFSSVIMMDSLALMDVNITKEDFDNGNLMFQQMISLSIIIGEIMDTFYTQGAIHVNTSIEQVLKMAKPLQLKLREWYHSLPSQLSMARFVPRKFSSNASLTLSYFTAEITLHRKIISSLFQNSKDIPKELTHVCRTAAKTRLIAAIEFVRDLKNEHINSFWYSNSTGNFMLIGTFAALLYVTSQTKEEATMYRDLLRNYIWILRVGSKSFDKLKIVLDNIHQLLTQVPGLLTDVTPLISDFIPPPLTSSSNAVRPGSMPNTTQQQMYNQYSNGSNPSHQGSSSSPTIADQGSRPPSVLQNNISNKINNSNNNSNSNNNNNNNSNNNKTNHLTSNLKNVAEQISPEDFLYPVMAQSPSNKTNVVLTPRPLGKTPIFSIPSHMNDSSPNNDNYNSNNTSTPNNSKSQQQQAQYSPSLQSQISETYSVGQVANPSETPKTEPNTNIMDMATMKDNHITDDVNSITTTTNVTNINNSTSIVDTNINKK